MPEAIAAAAPQPVQLSLHTELLAERTTAWQKARIDLIAGRAAAEIVRELSGCVDRITKRLLDYYLSQPPLAGWEIVVVAVGGNGRQVVYPDSDIDIVIMPEKFEDLYSDKNGDKFTWTDASNKEWNFTFREPRDPDVRIGTARYSEEVSTRFSTLVDMIRNDLQKLGLNWEGMLCPISELVPLKIKPNICQEIATERASWLGVRYITGAQKLYENLITDLFSGDGLTRERVCEAIQILLPSASNARQPELALGRRPIGRGLELKEGRGALRSAQGTQLSCSVLEARNDHEMHTFYQNWGLGCNLPFPLGANSLYASAVEFLATMRLAAALETNTTGARNAGQRRITFDALKRIATSFSKPSIGRATKLPKEEIGEITPVVLMRLALLCAETIDSSAEFGLANVTLDKKGANKLHEAAAPELPARERAVLTAYSDLYALNADASRQDWRSKILSLLNVADQVGYPMRDWHPQLRIFMFDLGNFLSAALKNVVDIAPEVIRHDNNRRMLALFERGHDSARILKLMYRLGVLVHEFPELSNLVGFVQPDSRHDFTGIEHAIRTVAGIDDLEHFQRGEPTKGNLVILGLFPNIPKLIAQSDEEILCLKLAALFHDSGQPTAGSSSEHINESINYFKSFADRIGLSPGISTKVTRYIRYHHLFRASRYPVGDDAALRATLRADDSLDRKFLDRLLFLTLADVTATKATVDHGQVQQCIEAYEKVCALCLKGKNDSAEIHHRRAAVLDLIDQSENPEVADRLLVQIPRDMLLAWDPKELAAVVNMALASNARERLQIQISVNSINWDELIGGERAKRAISSGMVITFCRDNPGDLAAILWAMRDTNVVSVVGRTFQLDQMAYVANRISFAACNGEMLDHEQAALAANLKAALNDRQELSFAGPIPDYTVSAEKSGTQSGVIEIIVPGEADSKGLAAKMAAAISIAGFNIIGVRLGSANSANNAAKDLFIVTWDDAALNLWGRIAIMEKILKPPPIKFT